MASVLVIYASLTGSTEMMAEAMIDEIEENRHEVVKKSFDFDPIDAQDLIKFDGILIGSYTWDDDIPYEVNGFYDELDRVDLTGKFVAVFGSCDSTYDMYGPAIENIASKVQKQGAIVYDEKLKIELEPSDDDIVHCKKFAEGFLKEITK